VASPSKNVEATPLDMRTSHGIIAVVALPITLGAQEQSSKSAPATGSFAYGHRTAVPTAVAARRSTPISLDAKLDEDAWKGATRIRRNRRSKSVCEAQGKCCKSEEAES